MQLTLASSSLASRELRLLAGVLAICLNVDYRILFTPPAEDVIRDGFEFYTTFYNSPPAIKASVHFRPLVLSFC